MSKRNPHYLSKSRYVSGRQCPKILWCEANGIDFDDSVMNESILEAGNDVGNVAMEYYGDFVEVNYNRDDPNNRQTMIAATKLLEAKGTPIIAEARYSHDDLECLVDTLRTDPDKGVHITEVKSSTSARTGKKLLPKPAFLYDTSFQYYVLTQLGYTVKSVSLLYLNKNYVREGELDMNQLFIEDDFTKEALAEQDAVARHIESMRAIAAQTDEPKIKMGPHCTSPYTCGYQQYCRRDIPAPSLLDISGRVWPQLEDDEGKKIGRHALLYEGIISFEDALIASSDGRLKLNEVQKLQLKHELNDLEPYVNHEALQAFLDQLSYPLYHLDFETFQQPIPQWDGVRPWMQIPFQYSLHIQDAPGAKPEHKEFLAEEGKSPFAEIARRLCEDIPIDVCVTAHNASFERGRLEDLAELVPEHADHLYAIAGNLVDTEHVFTSKKAEPKKGIAERKVSYYERALDGRSSIKVILPAFFPDDPELDYSRLDERVQNGGQAMTIYPNLVKMEPTEREEIRKALLAYCELDTLAMVKIVDRLWDISMRGAGHE